MADASLTLVDDEDPVLHKGTQLIRDFGGPLEQRGKHMLAFMRNRGGVGLAANQVGFRDRFFVFRVDEDEGIVCNPAIVARHRLFHIGEGCLSYPNQQIQVPRFAEVTMEYQDEWGNEWEETVSGLLAQVFQHELDHLNGLTIFDRMPASARKRMLRQKGQ